MSIEDIVFSTGGGFIIGAIAGYALKKLMKLAAIVIGLFVIALAYLSYKGWLDVKWVTIEDATRNTFANITNQAIHELNNTTSHFHYYPAAIGSVSLPAMAAFGFMPGLIFGLRRG